MNKNLFFKSILGFLVSRRGYFRVIFENQTGLTTKKSAVRKNAKFLNKLANRTNIFNVIFQIFNFQSIYPLKLNLFYSKDDD